MKIIIIVLVTITVSLVLAVLFTGIALQPGALSPAHKDIGGNCFKCHNPMHSVSASKCMDCHSLDQIGQISDSLIPKFHDSLNNSDCMACHSLHADTRSWQKSISFRHDFLSESLRNECASCHEASRPQNTLHLLIGGGNCGTCHTTATWSSAEVGHDQYFRFDRHHPPVCINCHTIANDFSQYSCTGCHEDGFEGD